MSQEEKKARRSTLLGCVLGVLLLPAGAYPWGPIGHRAVGQIAENHLSPQAAQRVKEILGSESLARASTWADEIRSDPQWRHASPWHYVTIEDDETYETSDKNPDGDVIEALERFDAALRDPKTGVKERREALRWLVHLVGDLHQPLHVGRGGDRGGNLVLVLWFNEPSNLHKVWDSDMIENTRLSFSELVRFLDHATRDEISRWQGTSYRQWAKESFDHRQQVYRLGDRRLGFEYSFSNMPLVEERLLQAGVRLAGALNSIFAQAD